MPQQIKILVIDDDPFLNKVYINKFAQLGFLVVTAMDGKLGLEKIRTEHPSLVVMDVVLPGMSGYEILKEVKADAATKDIPVVIVSNLGKTKDVQEAMGLGATDYLIKTNYTIDDILEKIQGYIRDERVKKVDVGDEESARALSQSRPRYPGSKMKLTADGLAGSGAGAGGPNSSGRVCPRCGASVLPGAHFCPNCGNKLE